MKEKTIFLIYFLVAEIILELNFNIFLEYLS